MNLELDQYLIHLGNRIRFLRVQKGLTQEKLSFEVGIHRTYLCDLELGHRNPSIGVLLSISKALSVGIIDLVRGID